MIGLPSFIDDATADMAATGGLCPYPIALGS